MNFSKFPKQFRPVRLVVAAIACLFLVLSNVSPAAAFGGRKSAPQSAPQEGAAQLNSIERQAEKVTFRDPDDLEDVQSQASKGINEVQGDADADKMKNPSNTAGTTTIEGQVKNVLEKATGN